MKQGERWRARLRAAVDRSGRKHAAIAWDAGIDPTTLSRILNGHMQPSFDVVVRIVHATGETLGWLMQERGYDFTEQERAALRTAGVILFDAMRREG